MIDSQLRNRAQDYARKWSVEVADSFVTGSSLIAYGNRDDRQVVLKVVKQPGDEWQSGEILQAFNGRGLARVYEWEPGALVMERLLPGTSLAEMVLQGGDEQATDNLAELIARMPFLTAFPKSCATVQAWGQAFTRYFATGKNQIPGDLVETAHNEYSRLCTSQGPMRLLHGDLQHYNVLFDANRGWLAIDPKGVIGELEYELGPMLHNPNERFASATIAERRLKQLTSKLNLDYKRVLSWGFAQAVLSAIWTIEDGGELDTENSSLKLAEAIRTMLR